MKSKPTQSNSDETFANSVLHCDVHYFIVFSAPKNSFVNFH